MSNSIWPFFLLILSVTGKSLYEDQSFENFESSEEYDLINPNLNDVIEAMQELDYIDKDDIKEKGFKFCVIVMNREIFKKDT